jgi:hypothetical protein
MACLGNRRPGVAAVDGQGLFGLRPAQADQRCVSVTSRLATKAHDFNGLIPQKGQSFRLSGLPDFRRPIATSLARGGPLDYARKPKGAARSGPIRRSEFASKPFLLRTSRPPTRAVE